MFWSILGLIGYFIGVSVIILVVLLVALISLMELILHLDKRKVLKGKKWNKQ